MRKRVFAWLRRTFLVSLFVGVAAVAAPQTSTPQPTTIPAVVPLELKSAEAELDVSAYQAELDRCLSAIKNHEEIPAVRKTLPAKWNVRVDDKHLEVSTKWVDTALGQIEENPTKSGAIARETATRLNAMREAAQTLGERVAAGNPATSRQSLEQIFTRKEFQQTKGPTESQLWIRHAVRWLAEKFVKWMSRVHLTRKNGNIFAWIVMTIVFVLLGLWVYRRLGRATAASDFKAEGKALPSDTRQWISDALSAAERGDFREAIHCGYWAAVASLEDHRLLERDRARTPRESLRLLGSHPAQQEMLGDLTRHFELIWYGYRPASQDDWSGARTLLEKMGCLKASTAATVNS
jgi:Domain of unknown function (DUF4129)